MIRDSPAFYKNLQQEAIGLKRDLEYEDSDSRKNEYPTYTSHFRTISPAYQHAPIIHRLLAESIEDLRNPMKRKQRALLNPGVVEWVIALLAELDVRYLTKIRYDRDIYLSRVEHGANGNPHWHSVLYSKSLGKLCSTLKKRVD